MKKILLGFAALILLTFGMNAQTQLENPGFENWEAIDIGPVPEPVDWNSLRTALPLNLAKISPAVWDSSTDAHSGKYSLYLYNVATFGIVAPGTITNERIYADLDPNKGYTFTEVDDPDFNMPLPHRPDSITGWFKCIPTPGDFGTIKVILHTDSTSAPATDTSNWIAVAYHEFPGETVSNWTRFSVPFNYYTSDKPDYIMVIITSGNGVTALDGSEAWFDDLALIYNDGTDINEITADDLKVYVTNRTLTVFIDDKHTASVKLQVLDMTGRPVYSSGITTGIQNRIRLDVPTGVYIVVANMGNKVLTRKVMIR
ncbi:MAG: T9SS type A sorting domain-containing protein [Chlorobi bacterium]|nr:T9SS type A sorting domain-containing protein [Chlorobiota bacterium]